MYWSYRYKSSISKSLQGLPMLGFLPSAKAIFLGQKPTRHPARSQDSWLCLKKTGRESHFRYRPIGVWMFPWNGVPQNGWFISSWKILSRNGWWLRVPLFQETSISSSFLMMCIPKMMKIPNHFWRSREAIGWGPKHPICGRHMPVQQELLTAFKEIFKENIHRPRVPKLHRDMSRGSLWGYVNIQSGWWFGTSILFSHILGIIIPIDFHIFQRGSNHQPDIYTACKYELLLFFLFAAAVHGWSIPSILIWDLRLQFLSCVSGAAMISIVFRSCFHSHLWWFTTKKTPWPLGWNVI